MKKEAKETSNQTLALETNKSNLEMMEKNSEPTFIHSSLSSLGNIFDFGNVEPLMELQF